MARQETLFYSLKDIQQHPGFGTGKLEVKKTGTSLEFMLLWDYDTEISSDTITIEGDTVTHEYYYERNFDVQRISVDDRARTLRVMAEIDKLTFPLVFSPENPQPKSK